MISHIRKGEMGAIIGVHAPGGLGKTELAKRTAEALKSEFEILWVDVGEKKPREVIGEMLTKCGIQGQPTDSYEHSKNELQHFYQTRKLLIVLDDVRQELLSKIKDILPPSPCAALVTSRIQQISGIRTFELAVMSWDQAYELFKAILGEGAAAAELETLKTLADRCKFNPLAMEIAARRIRQLQGTRKPVARYFEIAQAKFSELKMEGDERWDMERIFDISYLDLSEDDREKFQVLSAFHPTGYSIEAVAFLWRAEPSVSRNILTRFINLSLVKTVETEDERLERYRLHDLLDEYATVKLKKSGAYNAAKAALAEWLIDLFEKNYVPDIENMSFALPERDNLLYACEWARGEKQASVLALLTTQTRNWFFVYFTEAWIYWIAWLESCLQMSLTDDWLKANVLQAIGDVQQFRDERDAALESYHEALKLFKAVGAKLGEANVLQSLGTERLSQNDFTKALEFYKSAQSGYEQVGDKYSQSRNGIFIAYAQIGLKEYDKAIAVLMHSVNLAETINVAFLRQRALEILVAVSKETKSWEQTNNLLAQLTILHPDDIELIRGQANVFYEQKDYEKALVGFRRASEIAPDDSSIWNGVGNALESLKRYEEAIRAYSRAIDLAPDRAYLHRNQANVLLELNRLAEAEQDITKAVALEPDSPFTRARQGYLALARGNFAEAVPHFEFAVENDENKSWKFGLGLSKFALGDMEEAQKIISTSLPSAENEERKDTLNWLERIVKLKPELEDEAKVLRELLM